MINKRPKPTRSPAVTQPGTRHPADSISISPVCERRLKELEAFKMEHGHCNVPSNYFPNLPLAHWVAYVRSRKQSGAIASELARRLDGLGLPGCYVVVPSFAWTGMRWSPP